MPVGNLKKAEPKDAEVVNTDLRDAFFDELYCIAKEDKDVVFFTADMGAFSLEKFKKDFPKQYFNVAVAEQNMISVAAGMALEGKRMFVYSIVPFVTLRCFEQIKIDLCCMNLPVTIVGIGAGLMYGGDGPTHHANHDMAVMRALPNMTILNPSDAFLTKKTARMAYENSSPTYVRIEKGKKPFLYRENTDFSKGFVLLKEGRDVTIVSTGIMAHEALEAASLLKEKGIDVGVIDLFKVKPVDIEALSLSVYKSKAVVTLEEHSLIGGIGTILSELMVQMQRLLPLKKIALPDKDCFFPLKREDLHALYGIDAEHAAHSIEIWVRSGLKP